MNKKENFINSLSINRYLNNDLKSLDLEECLDLFNTLRSQCFLIIESFYDFSKVYIECLLQGENILEKEFTLFHSDEKMTVGQLLQPFVIVGNGMTLGDCLPILTALEAQKTLIEITKNNRISERK
ncbi:PcfO [Enterococcus faecalis]|uniref:PcfO n=1 Tax=Enterococcus faecalis TaxID=1351 RepID=UPI002DB743DA|nr:PcfO [Enterococcus faecalis]MEB8140955.1 PcfO [Enterococcus faecalis]